MREIKFRGKRLDNGNWVYGDLRQENSGRKVIMTNLNTWGDNADDIEPYGEDVYVNTETVGQFTGLHDNKGNEIYEGDIVKTKEYGKFLGDRNFSGYDHFEVLFKNGGFRLENEERIFNLTNNIHLEVVGNVHDNQELLKGVGK